MQGCRDYFRRDSGVHKKNDLAHPGNLQFGVRNITYLPAEQLELVAADCDRRSLLLLLIAP